MADFCKECSIEIFGEDFRDLANLGQGRELPPGHGWRALCEGCGYIILVDNEGKRLESDRIAAELEAKEKARVMALINSPDAKQYLPCPPADLPTVLKQLEDWNAKQK